MTRRGRKRNPETQTSPIKGSSTSSSEDETTATLKNSKIPRPAPPTTKDTSATQKTDPPLPPSPLAAGWNQVKPKNPSPASKPPDSPPSNHKTPVKNNFSLLKDDEGKTDPPPPPFYIEGITSFKNFEKGITELLGEKNKFSTKLQGKQVRLTVDSIDSFRLLQKQFDKDNIPYHTYQFKPERAFRVVIRGLHQTLSLEDVEEAITNEGFQVRKVLQCLKTTNTYDENTQKILTSEKIPTPVYFVDLEPNPKNVKIYDLKYLCSLVIKVEPPKAKQLIPQCKNCQSYGHTRRYCNLNPRCVKCGENHDSEDCTRPRSQPATCSLCSGPHPANFKGCDVYQKMHKKRFPPLREIRETSTPQTEEHSYSTAPISHQQPSIPHPSTHASTPIPPAPNSPNQVDTHPCQSSQLPPTPPPKSYAAALAHQSSTNSPPMHQAHPLQTSPLSQQPKPQDPLERIEALLLANQETNNRMLEMMNRQLTLLTVLVGNITSTQATP